MNAVGRVKTVDIPCPFCGKTPNWSLCGDLNNKADEYVEQVLYHVPLFQFTCPHCTASGPVATTPKKAISSWRNRGNHPVFARERKFA